MASTEQQIQKLVDQFVKDLTELVEASAFERVEGAIRAASRTASHPKKSIARRGARSLGDDASGGKRSPAELQSQARAIVAAVKKKPGIRADQIAKQMGVPTRQLALPIKKLLQDKAIHKKGQKRATAYFLGRGR